MFEFYMSKLAGLAISSSRVSFMTLNILYELTQSKYFIKVKHIKLEFGLSQTEYSLIKIILIIQRAIRSNQIFFDVQKIN